MWAARPTAQWCRSRGPRRDPSRGHPDAVALHDIARCARPLADHYRWLSYVRGGLRHRRGDDDHKESSVTFDEFERSLDKAFSKRIRLVAENPMASSPVLGCSGATTATFTSVQKSFPTR